MMTKKNALSIARNVYAADANATEEVLTVLDHMLEQLSSPRNMSDEAKAKASAKRKEKTAAARAAIVEQTAPVVLEVLSHTQQGMTAEDIYHDAAERLPGDWNTLKVQYLLLHELADKVEKIEAKGKANLYRLTQQ